MFLKNVRSKSMTHYSIEQSAEMIAHHKTSEYFKEVMQSYVNGSYRSAVVMLYSVVISDLVYKLKELKDLYEDSTAIDILDKVKQKQEAKPESGDWEIFLLGEIEKRTFLLEPIDKANLLYLRQQRHLSAHPVLTKDDLLSYPNKETVRALMRNMLEGILTKGAVMTTKVFTVLLNDLAEHEDSFADNKSLEKYLESRYFKNINDNLIKEIFKRLWDITFRCQSDECEKHRSINYRTIKIIYNKNHVVLDEYIKNNIPYFSRFDISNVPLLERLFAMLGHFPRIYRLLPEHTTALLKDKAATIWTLRVKASFLEENIQEHFNSIVEDLYDGNYSDYAITKYEAMLLLEWAEKEGCNNLFYDFLIKYFINSRSYDTASANFQNYIEPNLENFTLEQFGTLYEGINGNRQCHDHRMATYHNSIIKVHSDILFEEGFDYEIAFPNVLF